MITLKPEGNHRTQTERSLSYGSSTCIFTGPGFPWPAAWRAEDISPHHSTEASRTHARRREYRIVRHFVWLSYYLFPRIPDRWSLCIPWRHLPRISESQVFLPRGGSLHLPWAFC